MKEKANNQVLFEQVRDIRERARGVGKLERESWEQALGLGSFAVRARADWTSIRDVRSSDEQYRREEDCILTCMCLRFPVNAVHV